MDKNEIFCIDSLNMHIQQKIKVESLLHWLILFFTLKTWGINTEIVLISCIVTKTLTKEGFSVMAAIIWILERLPKDDGVVPFRILKSKLRLYRNSKKIVRTVIARFSKNLWFGSRTKWTLVTNKPVDKVTDGPGSLEKVTDRPGFPMRSIRFVTFTSNAACYAE